MLKTLVELEEATLQWSADRGILANGKATTQALKLMSEAGELAGNMADNTDISDDIGDCMVVLTNLASLTGTNLVSCDLLLPSKSIMSERDAILYYYKHLGDLCDNVAKGISVEKDITLCIIDLKRLCELFNVDLIDCWNIAYNDIKDRKGFLNANGNFIKSTDANYAVLLAEFESSQHAS